MEKPEDRPFLIKMVIIFRKFDPLMTSEGADLNIHLSEKMTRNDFEYGSLRASRSPKFARPSIFPSFRA